MKVSIIIPVYNVEPYIERCLKSVYAQTYSGGIEVIIVDDCGTDNSVAVAREVSKPYQEKFDIKFLKHEKNRGLSVARNTGIDAASGEYVYFIDSDDYVTDDCIDTLMSYAIKYPGVDLIQSISIEVKAGVESIYKSLLGSKCYCDDRKWIKETLLEDRFDIYPITAWNKLVRLSLLKKQNIYFEEGIFFEDNLWHFHLAKHVTSMCINHSATYYYIKREDSIMGGVFTTGSEKGTMSYLTIYRNYIDNIDPFCEGQQKKLIFRVLLTAYIYTEDEVYRSEIIKLYKLFAQKCNILGCVTINLIFSVPRVLLTKKIIFFNLIKLAGRF